MVALEEAEFHSAPATADRWHDLEVLFGPRGACGGCWCMWQRLTKKDFEAGKGEGNRRALKKLTAAAVPPGILLYRGAEPVGWCSIAPRPEFVRLERSRVLAVVDDKPVWSVACFFLKKDYRRLGLSVKLLEATVEFARDHGAEIIEGYPQDVEGSMPAAFAWTGLVQTFERAGFKEVARRSRTRPVMRRYLRRKP